MSTFDISQPIREEDHFPELDVQIQQTTEPQPPEERYGYSSKLNVYRNDIDNIKSDTWKKVRWYINHYDFLVKDPIINRAFYKYWEIINEFEIFENYDTEEDTVLHCAEAPGGFIQGTNIFLQIDRLLAKKLERPTRQIVDEDGFVTVVKRQKRANHKYKVYTISLNKDLQQYKSYNLPSYNKNVINNYVCVTFGEDNTGNINNWENVHHIRKMANSPFYLVTADGGFDEGSNFNNKEQLHYTLILSEIYAALSLQKRGGHFVLKVFDIFTETSVHLMYLLSSAYKSVSVYKPKTSRPTNSEKYIVCKDFCLSNSVREVLLEHMYKTFKNLTSVNSNLSSFTLFKSIPEDFVEKIREVNSALLDTQCEYLQLAIKLCHDTEFVQSYETHLESTLESRKKTFLEWEEDYNLHSYV